jgi:hypothetical protein
MKFSVKHSSNKRGVVIESPGPCTVFQVSERDLLRLGAECVRDLATGVLATTTEKIKGRWYKVEGTIIASISTDHGIGVVFYAGKTPAQILARRSQPTRPEEPGFIGPRKPISR